MIHFRIAPILLLCSLPLLEAKDKKAYNEISAETVTLSGKAYIDPEAVKQLLGYDLGGHYIVLQMTVTPKGEKPLNVNLNDFQLFCEGDGDRTQPQSPAEIAAADSMVLKRGQSGIGSLGEETGTTWSGVGFGGRSTKKKQDDSSTIDKDGERHERRHAEECSYREGAAGEGNHSTGLRAPVFPAGKKEVKRFSTVLYHARRKTQAVLQVGTRAAQHLACTLPLGSERKQL